MIWCVQVCVDMGTRRQAFVGGCGVCTYSVWARWVFACQAISRHKVACVCVCVCTQHGWGECAGWWGAGEACYLDTNEDDLNSREDELQLRLTVDVAHTIAHTEDIETDGAAAEQQQGAWQGQAVTGTSPGMSPPSPPLSTHSAAQHSPRTQMGPA